MLGERKMGGGEKGREVPWVPKEPLGGQLDIMGGGCVVKKWG